MNNLDQQIMDKAQNWLEGNFDEATKTQIRHLIENDPNALTDAFYCNLEFGTGGLRGIMGVGTNRMNKYTVGMATQGLCNYLKQSFPEAKPIKIAIAYDCRNNSPEFADIAASVMSANGIQVYLFDTLRPTPELSFAIRHLECHSGIVITASHNPKEYNGYKVYWNDGGQLVSPHDKNVITEVEKIKSIDDVKFEKNNSLITLIGKEIDEIYLNKIVDLSLNPEAIQRQKDLKIVYTPIHGTGRTLVPTCLKKFGFENVNLVEEQMVADGNFPTVHSPNPEESEALTLALQKAKAVDADLVMATDPDADRVGIAIKNPKGEFTLLNGNQTGSLLVYYLLNANKQRGMITGKEYVVKTIVTTQLIEDMAVKYGVECFNVLTGFKFIADIIKQNEGSKRFIGGGEESYGYLAGEFVRDKDAVMSCALIAEMTAWAKDTGRNLFELLIDMYIEYGFYKESLLSITRKGKTGLEEIKQMMEDYRTTPPISINNSRVVKISDYKKSEAKNILSGETEIINLPKSDVLQFLLEDGSLITVRPSGTEPKIKFYFGVKARLENRESFDIIEQTLNQKLKDIIADLKLNN